MTMLGSKQGGGASGNFERQGASSAPADDYKQSTESATDDLPF
jgi:hypothetical protein